MGVLITGITGFLGRHLAKYLQNVSPEVQIIGISRSEQRILCFKQAFPDNLKIKTYVCDVQDYDHLNKIFSTHSIDRIIHCAAMKNVGLSEENPTECVKTNIVGTLNLINLANKYGIKNFVAISTDKANTPQCVYGMSKYLMERMMIDNGFGVYQGCNLMWSDGSVLEFWMKNLHSKTPLKLFSNATRYFCDVNEVAESIITGKNTVRTYKIYLPDLLNAFKDAFMYDKSEYISNVLSCEKDIEELRDVEYLIPSHNELKILLQKSYANAIMFI